MPVEPQLYNSRIINSFLGLIRKRYRDVDIDQLLNHAEMKAYEVADEGHWFSQRQVDRFHEKVAEAVGSDIAREAGRYAASAEAIGFGGKYILGMIGPANAFHTIRKSCARFTRSSVYTSRQLAENKVEITVTPYEGTVEKPFQCDNRIGFFEAILMLFNYDVPQVEHPECLFKGDHSCRYIITWKRSVYARLKSFRNKMAPLSLAALAALFPFFSWTHWIPVALLLSLTVAVISYIAERLEKRELHEVLVRTRDSSQHLVDQVETNYNNARMVNEVGQAISTQSDIDSVLDNVIKAVENRLRYDRCLILLADQHNSTLRFRTGFGYTESQLSLLKKTSFNISDPDSKGVFVVSFREQRPILVNDFAEVSQVHSHKSVLFSEQMQAQSFICCPIVCEGESLGVLAVDNVNSKKKLVQSDMSLLMGIAPVIGISIRNAMYIDRERRMAEQLRQSQKMEAVGQLAGGIAHDFNNLLTAIIGFTNLAQMTLAEDDRALKFLEQVQFAADRATHLTQGLLAFSRKQLNNPGPVDLNDIVENIRKLLGRLITEEIELHISFSRERLQVMADTGQIEQILMNLVTNARDAMSGPGVLTIRTRQMEMTDDFVAERGYGEIGQYAVLSISDTGTGMDEATKARIFEPFFTTKEVGKGTGLGMAIVYGIVQQHEGYLEAESAPGKGTTFSVYLPLLQGRPVCTPQDEVVDHFHKGTETVLVAEDAFEVRRLTTEVLKRSGYRVIEAVDGEDAVEKFRENSNEVDLLIIDVVMPKMNGKDAFSEIARIKPQTKVLFTSGYTPDDVAKKGVTFAKENFLPKPASPAVLLKKVRELLVA